MNIARLLVGLLTLCISLPIWFYLVYFMLDAAHADRLVWFLFWIYAPITIAGNALAQFAGAKE